MSHHKILNLCARTTGHEAQHLLLRNHCVGCNQWDKLLNRAEQEGMSPLLKKHLDEAGCDYPTQTRRSLNILTKRHVSLAKLRNRILIEVLELFNDNGLSTIVLKGAALAHSTYPDPSLRPMRDIDLLLNEEQIRKAQELLKEMGFARSNSPISKDHYHLPSLSKVIDGSTICFEIHRGLYPDCPPYYTKFDFEKLFERSVTFDLAGIQARTFGSMDTLDYLFQHGIHAPITFEPFKLINIADLFGFVEKQGDNLNWKEIKTHHPLIYNGMELLNHITPWDKSLLQTDFPQISSEPCTMTPGSFSGWPHKHRKDFRALGIKLPEIVKRTFLPPTWWVMIYYGANSWPGFLRCLLYHHPKHIFWWLKLYKSINDAH